MKFRHTNRNRNYTRKQHIIEMKEISILSFNNNNSMPNDWFLQLTKDILNVYLMSFSYLQAKVYAITTYKCAKQEKIDA